MAMPEMTPPMAAPTGAPATPPSPSGAPAGQDMKPMLLKVLKKVKETAEGAGLDFEALVAEASDGDAPEEQASPRPPSPAAMGGM